MAPSRLLTLAAAASTAAAFTLTGDAVFVIPGADNSAALSLAFRDVQRDYYKTLGVVPVIVSSLPAPKSLPADTVLVLLGDASAYPGFPTSDCTSGWESHCVKAWPASASPAGYATILATGTGERGVIYGAYSFSELVLGVHPMWRFIDATPVYTPSIAVNDTLSVVFPPPTYTHRSWFPNDEDLLGGHWADPLGKGVFSAVGWDAMLETALRCKANGMLVGTNPFPDDDNVALVSRRGMVIHHHHYNLVGSNTFRWPMGDVDWDWRKDTATMSYVWRASVAAQAAYPEVVWSLGLRGLNDVTYTHCNGDVDCGRQISEALSNQTAWVAAAQGANATRVIYLWDELLPLLESGDLVVPDGTDIIFTDAGAGFIRVDGSVPKYATGVYYHTAMYNYAANQLTEMVPVDRIVQQLANFSASAKATKHAIINLSDLRPVPMTTLAFARMVWDVKTFDASNPAAAAAAYYADFGSSAVGLSPTDAATFSSVWVDYFAVPLIQNAVADNQLAAWLQKLAPALASAIVGGSAINGGIAGEAGQALGMLGGNTTANTVLGLLGRAETLAPYVPNSRLGFYTAHTLTNMATIGYGAQAVAAVAQAIQAYAAGGAGSMATVAALTQTAATAMDSLLAIRREGEGTGAWSGLYFTDHLSDMQLARKAARQAALAAAAGYGSHAPLAPLTPYIWYNDFEAWQLPHAANYPLINFNPAWNLGTYVRVNCVFANETAGVCSNNPSGGGYASGSSAAITLQVLTSVTGVPEEDAARAASVAASGAAAVAAPGSLVIRYTTDGTDPTPASPAYPVGGIALAPHGASVHVRAMAWINGVATGQITDAVYTAH